MKHYHFLTISSTKEVVTYSSLKNQIVNIYIEKPGLNDFCSISYELINNTIKLIDSVDYSFEEIKYWENKLSKLKNIIYELAEEKMKEETLHA